MRRSFHFAGMSNLYIRDGKYFYRLQLTASRCPHIGPREVRRSLRTCDVEIARLRCTYANLLIKRLIGKMQAMLPKDISPQTLKMAREFFETELNDVMDIVEFAPSLDPNLDMDHEAEGAVESVKLYRKMAVDHKFSPAVHYHVKECFQKAGIAVPSPNSDFYREAGVLVSRAKAETLRIYRAHLTGQFDQTDIRDPLFMPAQGLLHQSDSPIEVLTLLKAIKLHKAFNESNIKVGSQKDYDRVYGLL